jgi:hypothetical protein
MAIDKKEDYWNNELGVGFKWFCEQTPSKKDLKDCPEWEEQCLEEPKTKEEWKEARLYEWDGGEIGEEISGETIRKILSEKLISFLEKNGYELEINLQFSDDVLPLKISKMGRKKLINIPNKNKGLKIGDKIKVTKVKRR